MMLYDKAQIYMLLATSIERIKGSCIAWQANNTLSGQCPGSNLIYLLCPTPDFASTAPFSTTLRLWVCDNSRDA